MRYPNISRRAAGAALLEVQPGMASAPAGEVAAALARGVAMHKAWIHAAKQPASGSHRCSCTSCRPCTHWKGVDGHCRLRHVHVAI